MDEIFQGSAKDEDEIMIDRRSFLKRLLQDSVVVPLAIISPPNVAAVSSSNVKPGIFTKIYQWLKNRTSGFREGRKVEPIIIPEIWQELREGRVALARATIEPIKIPREYQDALHY